MELPFENKKNLLLSLTLITLLLTVTPLGYYLSQSQSILWKSSTATVELKDPKRNLNVRANSKSCNIFSGEWVPNPNAPYYTNETCWAIHEHQNCAKYGRPDTGFMRWRWKPNDCELPVFNAAVFLELLRGKKMAFVGDSVGRNHMQSLMCLLNRVSYPIDISLTQDEKFRRWSYASHNFTLAHYFSPFLVKSGMADQHGPTNTGLFNLHLDQPDDWIHHINDVDILIVSAGHWFFRPMMFYERNQLIGCHFCLGPNITDLTKYYGFRMAFNTTFRAINSLQGFQGMTFLRTFAPSHFEGGDWNSGGDCPRRSPFKSTDVRLHGVDLELYMIEMEEFKNAEVEGMKKHKEFRLLDTTEAMLMRPDGHPSRHGHLPNANVTLYNDCVHWCLPGPIDTLNDFLLHMLTMERKKLKI